jgi:8-oxo-dGTP pyrophosphatase MutT (NUDIX family)/ribosomal protein S18 acetylase RimI-like enzyme
MGAAERGGTSLAEALADYEARQPGDGAIVARFRQLLNEQGADSPFERARLAGHFTGSAWLVSADGRRALLMHHRKLDRWLQPGGHADGDPDLARVALREAAEETGLAGLVVEPGVFDLDRHVIPARGSEPEHWHHDVRFVVRATGSETFAPNEESHALAWRDIAGIAADGELDPSLRRLAARWLDRSVTAQDLRWPSERIDLIGTPLDWLRAIARGGAALSMLSGCTVADTLVPDEDRPAFEFFAGLVEQGVLPARWGSFLLQSRTDGEIIGSAGFTGPPNEGRVEIGYSVAPAYRGRGFAREAAACLVAQAFTDVRVDHVRAHTRAEENASVAILRRLGFAFVCAVEDPNDGPLWRWGLDRKS